MRKYAEDPEQQANLKKILSFFTSLSPQGLLDSLHKETKRDRRRLLLLLLECHGEQTREAANAHLLLPLGQHQTEAEIYFRRNLIYLLGKIPPSPTESLKDLSEVIAQHADLIYPPLLIKEAVTYLGHLKSERSQEALITLIGKVEDLLMNPSESPYEVEELHLILDRIIASLARLATSGAWNAVLDHAFKKKPKFGDTMSRLLELSKQDLSKDVEIVERLLAAMRANMPVKLLGLVIQQKDQDLEYIIEALSSTPLPRVRRALEEVKQKYPDRGAGATATKALANIEQAAALKRPEGVKPSLMGDLDLFGLPSLLQSLSDLAATGCLVLKNSSGDVIGTLFLEKGKLHSCHAGALTGDAAFYQLFEWPQPGTFQFSRTGERAEEAVELRDLLPLTLEGIRRYDELQQCRSVVPDKAKLVLKSDRPVPLPDEKDGLFFRDLWTTVRSGATALECDAAVTADSYRVRRLLVHWVEQGAIEAAI
jgi:hypothetical protein